MVPIAVGSSSVDKVYVGGTEVDRVYVGGSGLYYSLSHPLWLAGSDTTTVTPGPTGRFESYGYDRNPESSRYSGGTLEPDVPYIRKISSRTGQVWVVFGNDTVIGRILVGGVAGNRPDAHPSLRFRSAVPVTFTVLRWMLPPRDSGWFRAHLVFDVNNINYEVLRTSLPSNIRHMFYIRSPRWWEVTTTGASVSRLRIGSFPSNRLLRDLQLTHVRAGLYRSERTTSLSRGFYLFEVS